MSTPPFTGAATGSYATNAGRQVPGLQALHRMTAMLLAERTPAEARVLVLGAGGGLELSALAEAQPAWSFDGVDPSADMLKTAAQAIAPHAGRIALHEGYIDSAPAGPFDAATALLTFHFIARAERPKTLAELRRRLKPGAPLVLAHISFPQTEPARTAWIARHVAWGAPEGTDPARLEASRDAIATRLTILAPEEEEAMLAEASFGDVTLFYAALSFRGWIAYAR